MFDKDKEKSNRIKWIVLNQYLEWTSHQPLANFNGSLLPNKILIYTMPNCGDRAGTT